MRVRLRYIVAFVLLSAAGAGVSALLWLSLALSAAGPLDGERVVYIAPGSGVRAIAATLEEEGAVDSAFLFVLAARLQNADASLRAGEYAVPARASVNGIVALLKSGKTLQRRLTVAEGLTSREIVDIVNAAPALTDKVEAVPPEGALLPETYSYVRGESRAALVGRMRAAMTQTVQELWAARDEGLPVQTPEEAVVLASIVEKETGVAGERRRVAGVFVNRLRAGMPLQSDPTVIYALTQGREKLGRPLWRRDLKTDSPYNTYMYAGLPPGPIANPGRAALEAVLSPEPHDYFYFVADGTGGHAFAKTHDDHIDNVAAWRRLKRKQ